MPKLKTIKALDDEITALRGKKQDRINQAITDNKSLLDRQALIIGKWIKEWEPETWQRAVASLKIEGDKNLLATKPSDEGNGSVEKKLGKKVSKETPALVSTPAPVLAGTPKLERSAPAGFHLPAPAPARPTHKGFGDLLHRQKKTP